MLSFKTYLLEEYEFSSVQVVLPICIADKINEFSGAIPDEEIAEDGRELHPHITIKYGLHSHCPKQVMALELPESITITLGKTSIFENDTGDVLKVDIISDDLHKLNALIAKKLKVTDTYPDYIPHATIAYLKPGNGKKYAGDDRFEGLTWTFAKIEFSGSDDKLTQIDLRK